MTNSRFCSGATSRRRPNTTACGGRIGAAHGDYSVPSLAAHRASGLPTSVELRGLCTPMALPSGESGTHRRVPAISLVPGAVHDVLHGHGRPRPDGAGRAATSRSLAAISGMGSSSKDRQRGRSWLTCGSCADRQRNHYAGSQRNNYAASQRNHNAASRRNHNAAARQNHCATPQRNHNAASQRNHCLGSRRNHCFQWRGSHRSVVGASVPLVTLDPPRMRMQTLHGNPTPECRGQALAGQTVRVAGPEATAGSAEAVLAGPVIPVQAVSQAPDQRVCAGGRIGRRLFRIPVEGRQSHPRMTQQ